MKATQNWTQFCVGKNWQRNFFRKKMGDLVWVELREKAAENAKKPRREFIARISKFAPHRHWMAANYTIKHAPQHTPFHSNTQTWEEKLIFNCMRRPSRHKHSYLLQNLHCSVAKFFVLAEVRRQTRRCESVEPTMSHEFTPGNLPQKLNDGANGGRYSLLCIVQSSACALPLHKLRTQATTQIRKIN